MKKLLFALLLCFSTFFSFAQKDSVIKYSEVVMVEGLSKDQLFQRARAWLNDAFRSSKDVIQIEDKETGELAGKGVLTSFLTIQYMGSHNYNASYRFSIKIFVKDGRYKYDLSDFDNYEVADNKVASLGILTSSTECPIKWSMYSQKKMNEVWASAKEHLEPKTKSLIVSLKKAMSTPASNDF